MYGCYHNYLETVIGRWWGVQWPKTFIIWGGGMYNSGKLSMFVLCTHTKTLDLFTELWEEFGIKRSRSYNCWLLEGDDWVCLKKSGNVFFDIPLEKCRFGIGL